MKLPAAILAVFAAIVVTVDATVYFKEQFLDGGAVLPIPCLLVLCLSDCVVKVAGLAAFDTITWEFLFKISFF